VLNILHKAWCEVFFQVSNTMLSYKTSPFLFPLMSGGLVQISQQSHSGSLLAHEPFAVQNRAKVSQNFLPLSARSWRRWTLRLKTFWKKRFAQTLLLFFKNGATPYVSVRSFFCLFSFPVYLPVFVCHSYYYSWALGLHNDRSDLALSQSERALYRPQAM